MKKFIKIFLCCAIIFGSVAFAATSFNALQATFPILINGSKWQTDKPVVVIDGSTYLPLRAMAEVLGVDINWNEGKRQVEVGGGSIKEIHPSRIARAIFNNRSEVEDFLLDTNRSEDWLETSDIYFEIIDIGDSIYGDFMAEYMSSSTYSREKEDYSVQNLGNIYTEDCWVEGTKGNGVGQKIICKMIEYCEKLEWSLYPEWNAGDAKFSVDEVGIALEKWLLKANKSGDVPDSEWSYATEATLDKFHNKLEGFYIINGYAKDDELWKNNNRVKTLKLTIDGKEEYILELEDSKALQVFDINYTNNDISVPIMAEFEILDVYKGDKYDDTVLTTLKPFGSSNISWGGR
ncbi:MAG: copper amine oxidase N-terminal domain-containing protein [Clostridia bacterium]|nr:copper amine oxidase N-terminal domain-containing protein [Clostridia bacterium]